MPAAARHSPSLRRAVGRPPSCDSESNGVIAFAGSADSDGGSGTGPALNVRLKATSSVSKNCRNTSEEYAGQRK